MPFSLKYPWINPSMLILLQLVLKILMLLLHKKKTISEFHISVTAKNIQRAATKKYSSWKVRYVLAIWVFRDLLEFNGKLVEHCAQIHWTL